MPSIKYRKGHFTRAADNREREGSALFHTKTCRLLPQDVAYGFVVRKVVEHALRASTSARTQISPRMSLEMARRVPSLAELCVIDGANNGRRQTAVLSLRPFAKSACGERLREVAR